MNSALIRVTASTLARSRSTATRAMSTTNIAEGGLGKAWADKEHAAEAQYFNKKDAELLAQLASKLKNHTAPTEQSLAAEKQELTALLAKHDVNATDALLDDIIKFKFNHH